MIVFSCWIVEWRPEDDPVHGGHYDATEREGNGNCVCSEENDPTGEVNSVILDQLNEIPEISLADLGYANYSPIIVKGMIMPR